MKKLFTALFAIFFTGIAINAQNTITGVVEDETGGVAIGATIMNTSNNSGTVTDVDGSFSLTANNGDVIKVSYIGYTDKEFTVMDGKTEYTIQLSTGLELDAVTVIGSRGKPRTALETAVPIDVIGGAQLENSAQADLGQVLQYAAPSFHSTKQNIGHGSDHIDPMALRGLGADQTLVLINGKRRHATSLMNVNGTVGRGQVGTDLNAIPMAAVERIEILRDGAAAQYGSDAIAGVINIVLKENIDKGSISVRTGFLTKPPTIGDELNGLITNPYADIDGIAEPTQNDGGGESFQVGANYGISIGDKGGFANLTLNYMTKQPFNRMDDYTIEMFNEDDPRRGDQVAEFAAFNQGDPDAIAAYNEKWVDNSANNTLLAEDQRGRAIVNELNDPTGRRMARMGGSGVTNAGIFLNMELPLSERATFYSFGGYNYRLGQATGFVRRPNQSGRQSGLWPLGFSPHLDSDIQDISGTFGFRTNFNGWDLDLSNNYGSNSFGWTIFNSNNSSLGLESPTSFEAGKLKYSQNVINLDVSNGVDVGFPLNIGLGTEFRLENFEQTSGEDESWQNYDGGIKEAGSQVFPGYQRGNAINKFRFNSGLYADIEAEFTDAFLVGFASRFENYSDFGSNFSWKLSSRYRVTDNITIRGAYSTGFRAPSLPQKYFSSFTLQFISIDDPMNPGQTIIDGVNIAHLNDDSFITRQFGIENLKPETSTNISLGMTARLGRLSLTADIYQIEIKDRIGITGRFNGGQDDRFAAILDPAGLSQVQFMTNAVDTKTQGADIVASYFFPLNNGSFKLNLGANFTETRVPRAADGSTIINTGEFLAGFEEELFNREEVSRIEVAQPRNKIILGGILKLGNFSTNLTFSRFGKIDYVHPSSAEVANSWNGGELEIRDQTFTPKVLTDLDLTYSISNNIDIGIGGTNILNVYPDRHDHSGNYSGGMFPYSRRVSQFGIAGAGYYAKANFKF